MGYPFLSNDDSNEILKKVLKCKFRIYNLRMLGLPDIGLPGPCGPLPVPVVMPYWPRGNTYLEQTLQISFDKVSLEVRHNGSSSKLGPGPPRSRFGVQTGDGYSTFLEF